MKLLVTGGAGFIGTNFINYILKRYPAYEVVNMDALTYAGDRTSLSHWGESGRYTFVHGNILDKELVGNLVKECDAIIHFAAESHVDRSISDARAFIDTNVVGTFNLLEAAVTHNKKRFHHVSTDEVFGSLSENDVPFNEATPYAPRSPYSASKAASDHLALSYYHTYGLPVTLSNCSNNYGPYQFPEKLIPLAVTNLMEGKKVPLYGDGKQVRDWLYVEDHCAVLDIILHKGKAGERYCLGGNAQMTNTDVVMAIVQQMDKREDCVEHVEDRLGHDRRYAVSNEKICRELGWTPSTSFEDGLRATISWYMSNESWWKSKKHNI